MLACDAKSRGVSQDRAMRNACDSDSRCGWACDASTRDAKSLAIWVERCEPLRAGALQPPVVAHGHVLRYGHPHGQQPLPTYKNSQLRLQIFEFRFSSVVP